MTIPTRPICSPPIKIGGRLESADWIGVEILNMFNTGSWPTITKSVVESADSGIELANSTIYSAANTLKIALWARALRGITFSEHSQILGYDIRIIPAETL